MRDFTDGEQIVFNKIDRDEWIAGYFFIELARRLISEGFIEHVEDGNIYGFMSYSKIKCERVSK